MAFWALSIVNGKLQTFCLNQTAAGGVFILLIITFNFDAKRTVNHRLISCSILFFGLFFASCNPERRVEGSKEAVEKMKSMQIKRVTSPQVVNIVDEWGERIVERVQTAWEAQAKKPNADLAGLCRLKGIPQIDSLEKLYGVQILLLGAKDVKNGRLTAKEREVLDAYLYNAENKLPQSTNIQKLGDSVLIYNAPVAAANVICQKCFADDATKLGLWRVKFYKNEVIRKVDGKSLIKNKK
ncbi:hypothetical protein Runsl_2140 [Runella slithyformis DSM 19594]|uniref:Uncharacterized protein n=1 Tax=Runella slithyformis (strain ATCC 29530 / DSM 19594 / LMG 11500 / NCIMB 11436 / LSU 4) TaxID=761193 RepID=A0A7U4E5U4_RUNSL|nr:hypothetical protein Runsl_2140 [Runella slithyformis DSM 19594]